MRFRQGGFLTLAEDWRDEESGYSQHRVEYY